MPFCRDGQQQGVPNKLATVCKLASHWLFQSMYSNLTCFGLFGTGVFYAIWLLSNISFGFIVPVLGRVLLKQMVCWCGFSTFVFFLRRCLLLVLDYSFDVRQEEGMIHVGKHDSTSRRRRRPLFVPQCIITAAKTVRCKKIKRYIILYYIN